MIHTASCIYEFAVYKSQYEKQLFKKKAFFKLKCVCVEIKKGLKTIKIKIKIKLKRKN